MEQLANSIKAVELEMSEELQADILAVYKDYPIPY